MYKFKPEIIWRIKDVMVHDFIEMGVVGESARGTCWLAGGALRGLIDKKDKLVDFDLFFSNVLRSAEVSLDLESRGFKMIFKCPKGELTTYIGPKPEGDMKNLIISKKLQMKIQLITKSVYSDAGALLHSFDIDACRFAFDGKHVYTDRHAIRAVRKRHVTLHNVTHPNATFKRMIKYRDKGYLLTNEAIDFFTQKVYDMGKDDATLQNQFYVD